MDFLTLEKFQQLIQHQAKPSISMYMPAVKAGSEIRQNPVRFKNLVSKADEKLKNNGISTIDRKEYLKPVRNLIGNRQFWKKQEKGLAVYLAKNYFESFRLPLEFSEIVMLDSRFHIKPLIPFFVENDLFYLLTLSRNQIRLFAATRFDMAEISLPDVPASLEDALKFDDPERELQYQAGAAGAAESGAIYHGHHPERDQNKNIKRFFHLVDQGVMDAVGGDSEPLITAGLEYLHPIYRDANSYSGLLEEGVYSNPDDADLEEIHQEAWRIMEKRIDKSRQEQIDNYYAVKDNRTSEILDEIIPAAVHARVDKLFVDLDREIWGKYDRQQDSLERIPPGSSDSRDMVDKAVVHTLINGGKVYSMPETNLRENLSSGMAAIFRY